MIKVQDIMNASMVEYTLQDMQKKVIKKSKNIVADAIATYTSVASRNMPPPVKGNRSRSIPANLYYSRTLPIDEAIAKNPRLSTLYAKKNMGYKFVAFTYIKRGKRLKLQFFKSLADAKKNTRIKYRGLYKYLWGAKLKEIGAKETGMFDRLLSKSPDMAKKKNLVNVSSSSTDDETKITVQWNAEGISFFAEKSAKKAKQAMFKKFKKDLKLLVEKEIKK